MSRRIRPVLDEEMFETMLELISIGKSVRSLCHDPKRRFPSVRVFYAYLREDEERQKRYARAKEDGVHGMVDDMLHIADTDTDPQRARVRIDTRKWIAAKLMPTKYNDKFIHEHSGPGGGPMQINNIYEGMTEEEIEEIDKE